MGEAARRLRYTGMKARPLAPGQQIQLTPAQMKDAKPKVCECGCDDFIQVVKISTISKLISPTGQELTTKQARLACKDCGKALE